MAISSRFLKAEILCQLASKSIKAAFKNNVRKGIKSAPKKQEKVFSLCPQYKMDAKI